MRFPHQPPGCGACERPALPPNSRTTDCPRDRGGAKRAPRLTSQRRNAKPHERATLTSSATGFTGRAENEAINRAGETFFFGGTGGVGGRGFDLSARLA